MRHTKDAKLWVVLIFQWITPCMFGVLSGPILPVLGVSDVQAQGASSPIIASGSNTQVGNPIVLSGGGVQLNIIGGTRLGGGVNLFHSFGEFNVPENNIANFLNDVALPTNNILSRVTGGNPSNIFGTLQTEGFGSANFYLMNPAGIVFGPKASLNIGGDTHFTTADYLKLSDGVQFTALPSVHDAVLSISPVTAFGFLDSNVSHISVEGSLLSARDGQSLSFVGGDVLLAGSIKTQGGTIGVSSVASPGEVLVSTFDTSSNVDGNSFTRMGSIVLVENTTLDVSSDSAGSVTIRGGKLVMTNARISADTVNGNGSPVAIDVNVTEKVSISTVDGPALTAKTSGIGDAGEVILSSGGEIDISGSGFLELLVPIIDTHTSGPGNSGNVTISSEEDLTVTGDLNFIALTFLAETGTDGFSTGKGGNIFITTENFRIVNSFISTGNFFSFFNFGLGAGLAGDVTVSATEKIDLTSSSIITDSSDFIFESGGNAGNVALSAPEISFNDSDVSTVGWFRGGDVTINTDTLVFSESRIVTQTRTDPGGAVAIAGRAIKLLGSNIVSTTNENADAGDISITATERLSLLNSSSSLNDAPSGILSNSFSSDGSGILGTPGDIIIVTPILEMGGGSRINTTSGTSGNGGNVLINTQEIFMSGQTSAFLSEILFDFGQFQPTGIFTRSIGGNCAGPCGDAGNVSINTGSIVLENGAQINSGTSTDGRGGNLSINAADRISISGTLIDGNSGGVLSRSSSTLPGAGRGGDVILMAGNSLSLKKGATVSARSSGPANAGNIQLTAVDTILLDGTTVNTEAVQGSGGNITLRAQDLIRLNNSTISSSVQGDATTSGGNISIDPEFIILENSRILANAVEGQGGNISLVATNAILADPLSVLDASSALGVSGSVDIQAPIQNLSGTIAPLPEDTTPVTALYGARCASGRSGQFSTFVDSKSDSLSPPPGRFLPSPLLRPSADPVNPVSTSVGPQSPVILTASIAPLVMGSDGQPPTACP